MSNLMPLGARVLVKDEVAISDLSARAAASGLHLALFEQSEPKPTTGIVAAVGSDPEIQALIHVGDRVFFSRHSGSLITIKGEEYRSLDFHEIITVETMEESTNA
jgi:co-chaperonin GroES (HSP10)